MSSYSEHLVYTVAFSEPVLVALKCTVLVYLNIGFLIAVFTAGMVQRKPQYIAKLMAVQLFLFYVYLCTLASFTVTQGYKNTWSLHLPLLDRHEITIITHDIPYILAGQPGSSVNSTEHKSTTSWSKQHKVR